MMYPTSWQEATVDKDDLMLLHQFDNELEGNWFKNI